MNEIMSFTQFYQSTVVPENAVLICALGQAGFLIKGGGGVVLIDPYLSNSVEDENPVPAGLFHRSFPPPVQPEELTGIDLVFITHHHRDHCDPGTLRPILQNNPDCKFIAPAHSLLELGKAGIPNDRLLSIAPMEWVQQCDLDYLAIPAAHPEAPRNDLSESDYVGYLIKLSGVNIFHSGDTVLYDGLTHKIRASLNPIDIAFIVSNGRDEAREQLGIVGNLTPAEALFLAGAIHAELLIPMHNDLFAGNSIDPDELTRVRKEIYPGQSVLLLKAGDGFLYLK